jgi:membrane protease YdiL (CAAX protease family)
MLSYNLVSDRGPLRSLLTILLNVFIGFVVIGPAMGLGIASLFYDGSLMDLLEAVQDPERHPEILQPLLITQSVATLVGLIILPALHITAIERKNLAPFFPPQEKMLMPILLVMGIGITFMISISPLTEWNMNLKFPEFLQEFERWARESEERAAKLTETMTTFGSVGDLVIGLVVIALLPAIGEELVFRGMFQNELMRASKNVHLAIWFSAIIFSTIHFQFYGFVPRLLLGALFGYLYFWSGNLLIPIIAHFFNNAFGVIMIYLYRNKITDLNVEDNTAAPLTYVILNIVLTASLLYFFRKHYQNTQRDSVANFPE